MIQVECNIIESHDVISCIFVTAALFSATPKPHTNERSDIITIWTTNM